MTETTERAWDPTAHPADQRHQALTYADQVGWLQFLHVRGARPSAEQFLHVRGARPAAEQRYVVLTGDGRRRELAPSEVLPYVAGQADARELGRVIPPPREE